MILDTAASHPVVAAAQVVGLTLNWHLCRRWLQQACHTPLSCRSLLLSLVALLPTALVNACCALSATDWRPYALASLALLVRFTMVVQAGALGADALTGQLSSVSTVVMVVAGVATAALAWISGNRLRLRFRPTSV